MLVRCFKIIVLNMILQVAVEVDSSPIPSIVTVKLVYSHFLHENCLRMGNRESLIAQITLQEKS